MKMLSSLFLICVSLCLAAISAHAEDAPKFRTDDNPDLSLPWFEPIDGEFPPEEYAHYVAGELIDYDHINRTLRLRVDRQDGRAGKDEALDTVMLPYGSIYYHNAPAALRDIPIGTHLHGWFYIRPEEERYWEVRNGKVERKREKHWNASAEVDFTHCFRLEDDFSFYARRKQIWKVEGIEVPVAENPEDLSLDLTEKKLTVTLQEDGQPAGEPKVFDLTADTHVFQENSFAAIDDIKPGQLVQMNITWATLFGPGRITNIWLDEESRASATGRQMKRHHRHIRERGLPGFVTAVDDRERLVTITFFDSVDPALFKDLPNTNPKPLGWPTKEYDWGNTSPKGNIIVVRESLQCYNQVNDRKGGNIQKIENVPVQAGCSGVQIQVQCGILLEGFRPRKTVRFFPATWAVSPLPKEEEFHGRE
ncbi:MAG: hypothetical protein ACI8UO_004128 [Verrucomicrobiales bacterium]|jgi:hypothetical protein